MRITVTYEVSGQIELYHPMADEGKKLRLKLVDAEVE